MRMRRGDTLSIAVGLLLMARASSALESPFDAKPLEGPKVKLAPGRHPDDAVFTQNGILGVCRLAEGQKDKRTFNGPVKQVRIIEIFDGEGEGTCAFALQTDKGWFLPRGGWPVTAGGDKRGAELQAMQMAGPKDHPLLVLRWWLDTLYPESEEREEYLDVCALGSNGVPQCASLQIGDTRVGDTELRWQWRLDVSVSSDGGLVIRKAKGKPPAKAQQLIGSHALVLQ
jgi:hypothetical protein